MKRRENERKRNKNRERKNTGEVIDNRNNQTTTNEVTYLATLIACRVNLNEVYVSGEASVENERSDYHPKNKWYWRMKRGKYHIWSNGNSWSNGDNNGNER